MELLANCTGDFPFLIHLEARRLSLHMVDVLPIYAAPLIMAMAASLCIFAFARAYMADVGNHRAQSGGRAPIDAQPSSSRIGSQQGPSGQTTRPIGYYGGRCLGCSNYIECLAVARASKSRMASQSKPDSGLEAL